MHTRTAHLCKKYFGDQILFLLPKLPVVVAKVSHDILALFMVASRARLLYSCVPSLCELAAARSNRGKFLL